MSQIFLCHEFQLNILDQFSREDAVFILRKYNENGGWLCMEAEDLLEYCDE